MKCNYAVDDIGPVFGVEPEAGIFLCPEPAEGFVAYFRADSREFPEV